MTTLALAAACASPAPRVATHVDDWRDRVIYQIVTDRFANGDPSNDAADGVATVPGDLARMQGGDHRGITEHLDYVATLGASAIWISPITASVARIEESDGYHGYWPSDWTTLNPRFGDEADLRALVDGAHARGIAVIVDIVPNHAGRVFAYDLDGDGAVDDGEDAPPFASAPYEVPLLFHVAPPRLWTATDVLTLRAEHFHRRGIGSLSDYEQRRLGDFPSGLRDLDTERDDVLDALIETYARWALDFDLDGYRIDAVPHVEAPFWSRFCRRLREALAARGKHRFLLLGEIFEPEHAEIARHTDLDMLDAGFDIPLYFALIDRVILGGEPPTLAIPYLEDARELYRAEGQPLGVGLSPWEARVAIVDSHDLARVRGRIDDPFAADVALTALFTLDAIPNVYYGTEQELRGTGAHTRREPLWETGYRTDLPAYALLRALAALRAAHAALRRGTLVVRYAAETGGLALEAPPPDAGVLAWERAYEGDRALVVLATHPTLRARADIATGFGAGVELVDALGGGTTARVDDEGIARVELAPRSSAVLIAGSP